MEFERLRQLIHAGLRDKVKDDQRWAVAQIAAELAKIEIEKAEKERQWLMVKVEELERDYRQNQRELESIRTGVDINSL